VYNRCVSFCASTSLDHCAPQATLAYYAVFPSNDSAAITSTNTVLSHPFCKWKPFPVFLTKGTDGLSIWPTTPSRILHSCSMPKYRGYTNDAYGADGSVTAATTSDPNREVFYHVVLDSSAGNIDGATVIVQVVQTVEFFRRNEVADAESMVKRLKAMEKALSERKLRNDGKRFKISGVESKFEFLGGSSPDKSSLEESDGEWEVRSERGDRKENSAFGVGLGKVIQKQTAGSVRSKSVK